MENEEAVSLQKETSTPLGDEIKSFYQKDIIYIIKKVFLQPVDGTYSLFANKSGNEFFQSLVLIASSVLLTVIFVLMIIPSELREYISWFSIMMRAGGFTLIFLFLLSAFSFGVKMMSGKPAFRNELLTGALCGIPFAANVIFLFLFSKMMLNENVISNVMMGGYDQLISKAGIFLLFFLYTHLLLFNIIQQSLRSSGTQDALAWYLSPIGVFLAYFLTFKIIF